MYSLINLLIAVNFFFPLKIQPLVTSGFGEFRLLRFHAGVDFSTGGRTGYPVFATADGKVVRIRASYWGYGKVIYFQDDSTGHIFVYAHLERFRPDLERYVYNLQKKLKKYRIDVSPDTLFHYKKGEILGYTGKTGTRSPHLHFEIRNSQNEPINPLFIFKLPDTTTPIIESLRVISCKDGKIFSKTDTQNPVLYARKPFIVEVIAFDPCSNGNVTAPYRIELWKEDELVYKVEFDTFNYSYQRSSAVFYSLEGSRYGKKWIRLCNPLKFKNPFEIKAPGCLKDYGKYRLVVSDFYGHKAELDFQVKKGQMPPDTTFDFTLENLKLRFRPDGIYAMGNFRLLSGKIKEKFGNGVVRIDGKKITIVSGDTLRILRKQVKTDGGEILIGPYLLKFQEKGILHKSNIYYFEHSGKDYLFPSVLPINRKITIIRHTPEKVGLFSYGRKKWDFVGKDTSRVITLGIFKMLKDTKPPTAKFVEINSKRIKIKVRDDLSGIRSDSIAFYLDGEWEPVHYYFDLKTIVYEPPFRIKKGKHTYKLQLVDNLGNRKILEGTITVR